MSEGIRRLLIVMTVLAILGMGSFFFYQFDSGYKVLQSVQLGQLMREAEAYYHVLLDARSWNANLGGVYARPKAGLKPNPYLPDNTLMSEHGEELIKINPAWMTRQIAEIANRQDHVHIRITSLKPINPGNAPTPFEKEALSYFELHPNDAKFTRLDLSRHRYDYMGRLLVTSSCLQCHAQQGYKLGDIRGGIHITLPTHDYEEKIAYYKKRYWILLSTVALFVTILLLLFLWILGPLNQCREPKEEFEASFSELSKKTATSFSDEEPRA